MILDNIKTVVICPDHNEKYNNRKKHMCQLLEEIGIKNVTHHKSGSEEYPKCLVEALITVLEANMDDDPILILEDDVEWTGLHHFDLNPGVDCVYLGLSRCGGSAYHNADDGSSLFAEYSSTQVKVINMLSAHAVVYISKQYKQAVVDELKNRISWHADVLMSRIQKNFIVLANKNPIFYQGSGFGNEKSNVEIMTKIFIKTNVQICPG